MKDKKLLKSMIKEMKAKNNTAILQASLDYYDEETKETYNGNINICVGRKTIDEIVFDYYSFALHLKAGEKEFNLKSMPYNNLKELLIFLDTYLEENYIDLDLDFAYYEE